MQPVDVDSYDMRGDETTKVSPGPLIRTKGFGIDSEDLTRRTLAL